MEGITLSGLLGMFTLKKCGCSSLGWCLLVKVRGRGRGEGKGEGEGITLSGCSGCLEKMCLFKPGTVSFGEGGRVRGRGGGGGGKGKGEGKGKGGRWRASLHQVARDVYFEEIWLFKPG